jgi:hypothetical protein
MNISAACPFSSVRFAKGSERQTVAWERTSEIAWMHEPQSPKDMEKEWQLRALSQSTLPSERQNIRVEKDE